MATAKGIVTKVKKAVTEFFSPEGVSKSPARVAAGKKAAKTTARKAAAKNTAKKAPAAKRELIAPNGDKRFIRRDAKGRITESDDVGRSLSQDARKAAKTVVKPGQGDKGDQKKPSAKKAK